jgi:hypothetical protein
MQINTEKLNTGEIELIQWQYGGMGEFKKHLWDAISVADLGHLNLLAQAFPEQVQAYRNYGHTPGYWPGVLERAGLYTSPTKEGDNEGTDSV